LKKAIKILLVDDNTDHLYLSENMLKHLGFQYESAKNGKEALDKLNKDDFQIIISDILMPVMDGYKLCQLVKNEEEFKDIVFIFYTATYTSEKDENLAYAMGADKFIRKSTDPDTFLEILNDLIQNMTSRTIKSATPLESEKEILKLYNQQLVEKLEKKVQELEKSEAKYREAYNRAELYKDLFSHDISNIFQVILSAIQFVDLSLGKIDLDEEIDEMIQIIIHEVERGSNLVSNIKQISQMDREMFKVETLNAWEILKERIEILKNSFLKPIKIETQLETRHTKVKANDLIRYAFTNILANAVRHNENEIIEIIIKVSLVQKEGKDYLKVEFLDNGQGIEDFRKELIFSREDSPSSGIGLGLFLAKRIMDEINGYIWVEDRVKGDPSKGSNFILLIPATE